MVSTATTEHLLALCEIALDNIGFTAINKISYSLHDTGEAIIFNKPDFLQCWDSCCE